MSLGNRPAIGWVPAGAAALAAGSALGLPVIAMAQEQPAAVLSPAVTALLADIEAGRRTEALKRIARVESLSGRKKIVRNGAEFMDLVAGCKLLSRKVAGRPGFALETTEWQCEAGVHKISFLPEKGDNNPYVTVAEVLDPAAIAEAAKAITIPPPAPPVMRRTNLTEAEKAQLQAAEQERLRKRAEIRDAFGRAVMAGDLGGIAQHITPSTRFVFGSRDPFFSTDLVEMDDSGIEEGNRQVAHAIASLGAITGVDCKREGEQYPLEVCRWSFGQPDRTLFAMVHMQGERLSTVQLYYATREKMLELQKAAQERGAVGG